MSEDVRFVDLCNLVDFIYNGNVRIEENDLSSFLALGKRFKVKGVAEEKLKVSGK